ncbi:MULTISPECIES: FAD-linked oxidase C-terminal domain-containing protein [Rhodomicrobium]|uniref:FAD-binding oxidoreductase n=1 Tax=Rhodomicrobium TaxID=1068 RepID=UPI000B4BA104|nr:MULTISPECIES: FAD-linked oxidase C-terminal domain-containing protein [Rhodomicrobium]
MTIVDTAPANDNRRSSRADTLAALKARFGARFSDSLALRQQHAHTRTWLPNQPAEAVIFPESTGEVVEIVNLCRASRTPIIPFGVGTSLEGHLNAPRGGVCLDFARMKRVLAVNIEDMDCEVEPGITRKELEAHLRDTGLFFPVDPGADASLGGMAATRASGTTTVRYGNMRDLVLNLTAVMADGSVVKTAGRARKSSAGYDLTRLLVGSEGTLGIITGLNLKLFGVPEAILAAICPFTTLEGACRTVTSAIQLGLGLARIELLDALTVKSVNSYSKLALAEVPTLFLEFHGTPAGTREQVEMFKELAASEGGGPLDWAERAEDRNKLWQARHDAYWAGLGLRPGAGCVATDVCVPLSRLAECLTETHADIAAMGLIAPIVGHVGDGNFHVLPLLDMGDAAEVVRVEEFNIRLVERALAMGGTCTGEHGVGSGKMKFLGKEHGAGVKVMAAIKKALDPDNIFNPGKIIDLP